ncbi:TIGR02234 family membrane protein [Kitasatospora nipponensis]|uniref:TIGR02234 family membrane protein n=1 Tax=Kitasatospora nipponensis TaxID=258049 RepID=A0ABN1VVT8_9ACTN
MTTPPAAAPAAPPLASAPAAPAAGGGERRTLLVMLLLTLAGAVLVLVSVGRTWAQGKVAGQLAVSATGSDVSGLPGALALVGLASAVAIFAVRGAGRLAVGALVTLAGLGTAVAAALGAGDSSTVDAAAARKLALLGTTAEQVSHTAWPWVAALGGLLLAAAGLLTLTRGRHWPTMGTRYDAPAAAGARAAKAPAPARAEERESAADLWKALDRGEDPTAGR